MNENTVNPTEQEAEKIVEIVLENVPEERQAELAEKVEELSDQKPEEPPLAEVFLLKQAANSAGKSRTERNIMALSLRQEPPGGTSKVGITKKNKSKTRKALKIEKKSRRRNRGK